MCDSQGSPGIAARALFRSRKEKQLWQGRRKQAIERVPVDVRLWTSERVAQAIKEVAMEEDRSMSQLVRHWVHEALRARGVALSADESHILTSGCPIWARSSSPNAA
jgi:hypothetical protein